MQALDALIIDCRRLLTGQVQPTENGVRFTMFDPANRTQATTFDQHRDRIQKYLPIGAQCFKESSFVGIKGLFTGGTVIPSFSVAVDLDILGTNSCKVSPSFVIAPLLLVSQPTSPLVR